MADKFLLPCPECGKSTPVSASQAGSTLPCDCRAVLEVPTIRQMRQLEPLQETREEASSEWTARSGAIFLGVFLTIVTAAPGIYLIASWPEAPQRDVPKSVAMADAALTEMPVDRTWLYWYNEVELRGLVVEPGNEELAYLESTKRRRWFCFVGFGAAGISLIFLLAAVSRPVTQ